jgi:hypothetical protein
MMWSLDRVKGDGPNDQNTHAVLPLLTKIFTNENP